ncbi:hypothetical protein Bbelb_173850 [Branchiostoma belcheri]|nr:hypothetical protein Bbelb_173850 [Branchiostoma belcheri]
MCRPLRVRPSAAAGRRRECSRRFRLSPVVLRISAAELSSGECHANTRVFEYEDGGESNDGTADAGCSAFYNEEEHYNKQMPNVAENCMGFTKDPAVKSCCKYTADLTQR